MSRALQLIIEPRPDLAEGWHNPAQTIMFVGYSFTFLSCGILVCDWIWLSWLFKGSTGRGPTKMLGPGVLHLSKPYFSVSRILGKRGWAQGCGGGGGCGGVGGGGVGGR